MRRDGRRQDAEQEVEIPRWEFGRSEFTAGERISEKGATVGNEDEVAVGGSDAGPS